MTQEADPKHTQAGPQRIGSEREFETGNDEFFKGFSQMNALNLKRTYDAYQDLDLMRGRDAQKETNTLSNLATQALQNAVETANMVAKQAVRHSDLSIDRIWNVDEQGYTAEKILATMQDPAVAMAMAAAIAKTMNQPASAAVAK